VFIERPEVALTVAFTGESSLVPMTDRSTLTFLSFKKGLSDEEDAPVPPRGGDEDRSSE